VVRGNVGPWFRDAVSWPMILDFCRDAGHQPRRNSTRTRRSRYARPCIRNTPSNDIYQAEPSRNAAFGSPASLRRCQRSLPAPVSRLTDRSTVIKFARVHAAHSADPMDRTESIHLRGSMSRDRPRLWTAPACHAFPEDNVCCNPRFLSISQVQRELGLTRPQITELIDCGTLPAFQIFSEWRIERAILDRFVDQLYEQTIQRSDVAAKVTDDRHSDGPSVLQVHMTGTERMTQQQQRIVLLVGQGLSNAEIAERLSVEISTIKSHVSRILQRLNMPNRQQLIVHLWRSGALKDSEPRPPI